MLYCLKIDVNGDQSKSSDINFLEQNFSQLSEEGQSQLKDYLQSLVSLQNTITEMKSTKNVYDSLNKNLGGN